jgi:hypothetical protein
METDGSNLTSVCQFETHGSYFHPIIARSLCDLWPVKKFHICPKFDRATCSPHRAAPPCRTTLPVRYTRCAGYLGRPGSWPLQGTTGTIRRAGAPPFLLTLPGQHRRLTRQIKPRAPFLLVTPLGRTGGPSFLLAALATVLPGRHAGDRPSCSPRQGPPYLLAVPGRHPSCSPH